MQKRSLRSRGSSSKALKELEAAPIEAKNNASSNDSFKSLESSCSDANADHHDSEDCKDQQPTQTDADKEEEDGWFFYDKKDVKLKEVDPHEELTGYNVSL